MRRAVIVAGVRTPIGRARKGTLVPLDAYALARVAVSGVLGRAEIPTNDIDDIVLAESMQGGGVIARHTAVSLGLQHVPGQAVNRPCAGGLDAGYFDDEIIPVAVPQADGSEIQFTRDEHPRRGVTVETLAELPALHPEIENATVTAGNASGINDAAAAVIVTSEDYAQAHGL